MARIINHERERQIVDAFATAGRHLSATVRRARTKGSFLQFKTEQLGAIAGILTALDIEATKWARENIPDVIERAAQNVDAAIQLHGEDEFSTDTGSVSQDAVDALTEQTVLDFQNTITSLKRTAERTAIKKLLMERNIVQETSNASSNNETLKALADEAAAVVYSNGAQVPVEAYVSMLVRTQMMTAYNVGTSQQLLAAGRLFAIFPTIASNNRSKNDPCWAWEEKRYINLQTDPIPPASTHPNCRHVVQPISFEQLKAERPDLYEQAVAFFNRTAA